MDSLPSTSAMIPQNVVDSKRSTQEAKTHKRISISYAAWDLLWRYLLAMNLFVAFEYVLNKYIIPTWVWTKMEVNIVNPSDGYPWVGATVVSIGFQICVVIATIITITIAQGILGSVYSAIVSHRNNLQAKVDSNES